MFTYPQWPLLWNVAFTYLSERSTGVGNEVRTMHGRPRMETEKSHSYTQHIQQNTIYRYSLSQINGISDKQQNATNNGIYLFYMVFIPDKIPIPWNYEKPMWIWYLINVVGWDTFRLSKLTSNYIRQYQLFNGRVNSLLSHTLLLSHMDHLFIV